MRHRGRMALAIVLINLVATMASAGAAAAVTAYSFSWDGLLKDLPVAFEASGTNDVLDPTFTYPDPAHGSLHEDGPVVCTENFGVKFCNQPMTYTPDAGFVGTDVWQYTVHDPLNGGDAFGVVSLTFVDDVTPPDGSLDLASTSQAGAGWTNVATLGARVDATDDYSGVSQVRLSNLISGKLGRSGTFAYPGTLAPTVPWSLAYGRPLTGTPGSTPTLPPGTYTVYARWRDGIGNWSAVSSASIKLDPYAPTLPALTFGAGSKRFAPGVPVHVAFPASDTGGSGVELYELQWSINGAPFVETGFDASAGSSDLMLAAANTYRLRARARDLAGGWSPRVSTPTFKVIEVDESSGSIAYAGSWRDVGASKMTTAAGATATLTFTGREGAWATVRGPNMGKANVYVDGSFVKTVDLYSASTEYSWEAFRATWSSVGAHKITVKGLGTSHRPEVHVDWFLVVN